ncbi:MAG: Type 1 glutamine amidotransferase-like domain-containing protein, partial [Thermoplasmata archaeon]
MGKIVAIGGGNPARPLWPEFQDCNTYEIDREIFRLAGSYHAKLAFIPTASYDDEDYICRMTEYFSNEFGADVNVIRVAGEGGINIKGKGVAPRVSALKEIEKQILDSDIIYVGWGDTDFMMRCWKKTGLDKLLKKAWKMGKVCAGISAGGDCWFQSAFADFIEERDCTDGIEEPHSRAGDYENKSDEDKNGCRKIKVRGFHVVRCLDIVPAMFCPHYNSDKDRRVELKKYLTTHPAPIICADDGAALEIVDGRWRSISSCRNSNVRIVMPADNVPKKHSLCEMSHQNDEAH